METFGLGNVPCTARGWTGSGTSSFLPFKCDSGIAILSRYVRSQMLEWRAKIMSEQPGPKAPENRSITRRASKCPPALCHHVWPYPAGFDCGSSSSIYLLLPGWDAWPTRPFWPGLSDHPGRELHCAVLFGRDVYLGRALYDCGPEDTAMIEMNAQRPPVHPIEKPLPPGVTVARILAALQRNNSLSWDWSYLSFLSDRSCGLTLTAGTKPVFDPASYDWKRNCASSLQTQGS